MSECIESNVPTLQRMVDCLRADNARLVGEVEKIQDDTDDDWLNSIAKHWIDLTGNLWDTRDGETREEGLDANVTKVFQHIEDIKANLQRHKDALEKARVALGSSASAWKKMADGLDRVKSEGETSVELGCEVAATFRLHQCGCEHALTTINEVLGEK